MFWEKRTKIAWVEFSGDLRKNFFFLYFIALLFILSADQMQSFPVNIQLTVSLTFTKTANKSRNLIHQNTHISLFLQWLVACHRRGQCLAGVFGCSESRNLPAPSKTAWFKLLSVHIHAYSSMHCFILLQSRKNWHCFPLPSWMYIFSS